MSSTGRISPVSFFPRLRSMLFVVVFMGFIAFGSRAMNLDGDLGRHLTIGGYILDQKQVPTTDLFSHTLAGETLTPHEWLSQVLLTLAYRLLGLDGVVVFSALLVALAFSLVLHETLQNKPVLLVGLGFTFLGVFASSLHWLTRPHLFTFVMLAAWMSLLERLRRGDTHQWWPGPVLMLAWANLHGAFVAGFAVWAMVGVGYLWDRFFNGDQPEWTPGYGKRLLLLGITSIFATLVNPVGVSLWTTSLGYLGNQYLTGHTNEYLSPDFHQISTWPFLLMVVAGIGLLGVAKRRIPGAHVLLLAGWVGMGLYSARNIPLFALIAAPILSGIAVDWLAQDKRFDKFLALDRRLLTIERTPLYFPWSALAVILVVLGLRRGIPLDLGQAGNRFQPSVFPVEAVNWLDQHPPQGPVFNYFPWGGYILYRMWPGQKVFIDGQTDFYGEALTRQYEQVISLAPGWQDVLTHYGVHWVMMPSGAPLNDALLKLPDWQKAYQDQTTTVIYHVP